MRRIVFIDTEISNDGMEIQDLGAVKADNSLFHSGSVKEFLYFISGQEYLCGHNILNHDLPGNYGCGNEKDNNAINTIL